MIGRAVPVAVLAARTLEAHASKFAGPDVYTVYLVIGVNAATAVGMPLAAVVFAIQSARLCHPARRRIRQALWGALLGALTVGMAVTAAALVWFPMAMLKIEIPGLFASLLAFLGVVYAGYRLSTRFAASAPSSS